MKGKNKICSYFLITFKRNIPILIVKIFFPVVDDKTEKEHSVEEINIETRAASKISIQGIDKYCEIFAIVSLNCFYATMNIKCKILDFYNFYTNFTLFFRRDRSIIPAKIQNWKKFVSCFRYEKQNKRI